MYMLIFTDMPLRDPIYRNHWTRRKERKGNCFMFVSPCMISRWMYNKQREPALHALICFIEVYR